MRNYSYGQEFSFLPNNAIIRLDKDLANNFLLSTSGQNSMHHSRKNSHDPTHNVDINLLAKKLNNQMINKDLLLNEEEFDEEPGGSQKVEHASVSAILEEKTQILTHRRNNSKDLTQDLENNPINDLIKIDNEVAMTQNNL